MHTILVLDDDASVRRTMCRDLHSAGYGVLQAADGDQAFALLNAEPVDLLITDILMPGRDGLEIIREIRKRWPQLKLVAMSGGGFAVDGSLLLNLSLQCGAAEVMEKPFSFEQLRSTIQRVMQSGAAVEQP